MCLWCMCGVGLQVGCCLDVAGSGGGREWITELFIGFFFLKKEKTFKNEQRSKDAAAKKRPNTSGVGKINNYYEDIYIPPYH